MMASSRKRTRRCTPKSRAPFIGSSYARRLRVEELEDRRMLAVITVDSAADNTTIDGMVTLREAIQAANTNTSVDGSIAGQVGADTIHFSGALSGQTITLGGTELAITETLTLDASALASGVTIDADSNSRVLNFSSNTGNLTLEGLSITGGLSTGTSQDGGGVRFFSNGTLTLSGSTVSGNTSGNRGGGIFMQDGALSLTSSTVSGNTSGNLGGGIYTRNGAASLTDSTVSENTSSAAGGGIFKATGDVSLTNSTVSGNHTTGSAAEGGGIFTRFGTLSLTSSTVSGNSTAGSNADGAGIFTNSAAVSLTSSTVSGNTSGNRGGGIYTRAGVVALASSTVSGNSASAAGGGIFVANTGTNPTFTIENSIVAANTDNGTAPDLLPDTGGIVTVNYSLIGVADLGLTTTQQTAIAGGAGNLTGTAALPLDPLLGPLADNGGPTQTHALLPGSPALDAGDDTVTATEDQRGLARNVNGVDIGSFERQAVESTTLVVSTNTDVDDGNYAPGELSLREAIVISNLSSGSDTITFDASIFTGGSSSLIRLSGTELEITDTLTIDASMATDVTITGDAAGDDMLVAATFITDVAASETAGVLADNSRVLNFSSGTGDLTLQGLSITGGRTTGDNDDGGGIRFDSNGTLALISSTVSGNSTTGSFADGGGIFTRPGAVSLTSSTVSGNTSSNRGGGIYTLTGAVSLTSSTVIGNSASSGRGGGFYSRSGVFSLTDSTVSGNTSGTAGGGIYKRFGALSLTSSTVSGNNTTGASAEGGGIFTNSAALSLTSSTVSGNTSGNRGGGIYTRNGSVSLASSTVSENSAGGAGGGIFVFDTSTNPNFTIENSIVAVNTDNGTAADLRPDTGGIVTVNYSLIGDSTGSGVTGATGTGNILNQPALLGPLADNGGPTPTHALLPGSPALDAGDDTVTATEDQRGLARNVNGVDIGSFERQAVESTTLVVSTNTDVDDGNYAPGELSLREAIVISNLSSGSDTITFDASVFTGGSSSLIRLSGTELVIIDTLTIDASTATDVTITGDAAGDDITDAANITDVVASLSNNANSLDDNSRVLNFSSTTGDLTLEGLSITGGRTTGKYSDGGGIRFNSNGTLTLSGSTVSGNSTTGVGADGGGIFTSSGSVSLTSSTVSGNITTGSGADGGGIFTSSGSVSLTSSTVSGNTSAEDGGGIRTYSGAVSLISSTVSENSASGAGGGLFVFDTATNPTFTIENSIVAANTDNGTAPDLRPDPNSALTINYSLIGDSTGSGVTGATGTGNILNQPALLGPLADNGGPTQTHALLLGSPAFNAGDPASTATDQRGVAVVFGRRDIGAFEFEDPAVALVVSTTDDVVDNDLSSGNLSLREAIRLANLRSGSDTITFDASIFTGGSSSLIRLSGTELEITDTLTIDASTATDVTITGDAAGDDQLVAGTLITDVAASETAGVLADNSRVLNFSSTTGDLTLQGLSITGGRTSGTNDDGGGIRFDSNGTLALNGSTVSGNSITGSIADGGGIYTSSGAVTLTSSTVSGNSVTGSFAYGGGIYTSSGAVTLTSSTVSGNTSGDEGGGIFTVSGAVSLTSSTVSGNTSGDEGGGIFTVSGAVSLTSSTVSGNTSGYDGGGIFTVSGAVSLTSSTVSGNSAGRAGGGIFVYDTSANPTFTIENSIVAANTDNGTAPDLRPDTGGIVTVNYSLIGVADLGLTTTQQTAIAGGAGNLTGTAVLPLDPLLGPLADNGGPTQSHALLPGSPALDVGNATGTDQRGFNRPVDLAIPNAVGGNGADIGAFEAQETPSLVVTTIGDVVDETDQVTSLREAIAFANILNGSDTITFDASIFTGGSSSLIRLSGTELEITDTLTIDASTATDVVITGDATGDDLLVAATFITDVAASQTAGVLADNSRVLNFSSGTGDLTLEGLSISGGRTTGTSQDGGGIRFNSNGTLTLISSTVSGNSTTGSLAEGGGIGTFSGDVSLTSSTVSGNSTTGSSAGGGGIYTSSGAVSLTDSTVSGNSTTGSIADGGGIYTNSGAVSLNSSTVSGNTSGDDGGGIRTGTGAISLTSSTVSGNTSGDDGGGIFTGTGAVSLTSSTVSGNSASGAGGGLFVFDTATNPTFTIENSIVAANTDNGTAPDLRPDPNSAVTINYSLIGDSTGSGVTGATGTGNILNQPALLGPLADNGGPTQTHALLFTSPAFNAGDPAITGGTDQRGDGFARFELGRADMGAFELNPFADFAGDVVVRLLAADPTLVEITVGGATLLTTPLATLGQLDFVSPAGDDDSLTIDYTNGYFATPSTLSFVGDLGDNDTLNLIGDTSPRRTRVAYEANLGSGTIDTANGLQSDAISFSEVSTVDLSNLLAFEVDGLLAIGAGESLTVEASSFAGLGAVTIISGGTFDVINGVSLSSGEILTGTGSIGAKVAAGVGSVIEATGNLTLGDDSSVSGYLSDGELHVGTHTVTILDSNEAVLGSLTTLGDGATGGTLDSTANTTTNSGLPLDFLLEAGKNVTGRGEVRGNFNNMGNVIGDGTTMAERVVFATGFTVKGIGYAENVLYEGTHSPGLSPAAVTGKNQAFGGTLQLELGGTTPGNGPNSHDQVIDLGGIELVDGVDLEVLPWNGFQPSVGDEFEVLVSSGGITGTFDAIVVDPAFTQQGIDFELNYDGNSLTLMAIAATAEGDFNADGVVSGADFLAWQRGESPEPLSTNDLDDWQANYGQSTAIAAASSDASVPQPTQPAFPEIVDAELIDAAMAWDLANSVEAPEGTLANEAESVDEVFDAVDLFSASIAPTTSDDGEDFTAAASEGESSNDQWLADELLERVFG